MLYSIISTYFGAVMGDEIIAMIFSILGMLVNIISFQVKNKRPLLLLQSLGNVLFLISFIFNASGIAVILNVIYLARNFTYIYYDNSLTEKKNKIFSITFCAAFLLSYAIYTAFAGLSLTQNLFNFLPVAASLFGTVATACNDVNRYRAWKFGDSYCWLFFNASFGLGSLGGIVGEIFNQISLTVGIIRYKKKSSQ